jgi:hypothetical protein
LEVELRVNAKEGIGGDGAFKKLRERERERATAMNVSRVLASGTQPERGEVASV